MTSHPLPPIPVPVSPEGITSPEEIVIAYHERTKHHFHRFAASLGYLDWVTQPDPFRRYEGAPLIRLPLPPTGNPLPYWQLYVPDIIPSQPLNRESLSLFFRYALSLTAWKHYLDSSWSLRANPSSGNLHPTEGYAILPAVEGIGESPGVYHYAPKEHGLERRASLEQVAWNKLVSPFPNGSFIVGLTSIHWREAWKYGERAFRYCQQDAGHALATMRIAAAALGWNLVLLDDLGDEVVACLLGVDREVDYGTAEQEEPEMLAVVTMAGERPVIRQSGLAVPLADGAVWHGTANLLSPEHGVNWPLIDEVAHATRRSTITPIIEDFSRFPTEEALFGAPVRSGRFSAEKVILGRRSAVAMDRATAISAHSFFQMLARLIPTRDRRSMPWDTIPWRPRIHLGLFVHRVEGLVPGLYALVRDPDKLATLRQAMRREFRWQHMTTYPTGLPLYLLQEGDFQAVARAVSCGQEIAGDGAFSLGMIAEYMESLANFRAAFYRNLFWEAGMVGQVLYLEAEEAGIRSTGMGCYFDDPFHEVFGIATRDWQSFYHFTVGGPLEDPRLTTLPAYG